MGYFEKMGSITEKTEYARNTCPSCGGNYEFLEQEVGREWNCPHCGGRVVLRGRAVCGGGAHSELRARLAVALRWACVLPAAVCSYFLVLIPLYGVEVMAPYEMPAWAKSLIGSAATSVGFVYGGARTAPRFRFVTALVLTVLHAVILTFIVTITIQKRLAAVPPWWLGVCFVVALAASICVCVVLRKGEE